MVVTRTGGTWSQAIKLPGSGKLNPVGSASVAVASCAAPANCGAAGSVQVRLAGAG